VSSPRPTPLPRDSAAATKRLLRAACDTHGVEPRDLARALGEHDDTVAAWLAPHRCNQVPMWILGHPGLPAAVREFLLAGLASSAGAPRAALGAATTEDQANVCTGRAGELLVQLAAALRDRVIDPSEARALLPVVRDARRSLEAFEKDLTEKLLETPTRGAA